MNAPSPPEKVGRGSPGRAAEVAAVIAGAGVGTAGAFALFYLFRSARAAVENFVVVFVSIVVEALPFVLAGAFVSGLIAVAVPDRFFAAVSRLPVGVQLPAAVAGSFAFPVCECGSVPVARRLILRGVHPSAGVAFMLAAPVLNPVVLASTWVAYAGRDPLAMTAGRAILGAAVALLVGAALKTGGPSPVRSTTAGEHGHDHGSGGFAALASHVSGDFLFMGRFVVAGAALAALLQTAVPQDAVAPLADSALLGSLAMMALAFAMSLCSEADAFVAVSFTHFTPASQLSFLVFGPVLDLKLALLYAAAFGRGLPWLVALVSAPVILAGSLWFGMIFG